jgi:hypothetical protein
MKEASLTEKLVLKAFLSKEGKSNPPGFGAWGIFV